MEVRIEGTRRFGFALFKFSESAPRSGGLSDLLRAGQADMWTTDAQGGGRVVEGVSVFATAVKNDSAVEISLRDNRSVQQLRQNRPMSLNLVVGIPGIQEQSYSIAITYEDK